MGWGEIGLGRGLTAFASSIRLDLLNPDTSVDIYVICITIEGMPITKTTLTAPWLLLVFSLPKKGASVRVSIWRKLQRYGSLPLGNSGYLLPNSAENREKFEWLATAIRGAKGEASVLEVQAIDNCPKPQLMKRFSDARSEDYRELLKSIRSTASRSNKSAAHIGRLRQRFLDIVSIDFFGSPLRGTVDKALAVMQEPRNKLTAPDLDKKSRAAYRGRTWVTRPRPGVDRVMSAWLIRRFIDPKARFVFATEDQKPGDAVPYDMYEGDFGHRGEDCTFETLTKAFQISDKRVGVMGQIVHDADLFDEKFGRKEGFGVDEIMKGWARQGIGDDELLERGIQLTEGLFQSLG